MEILRIGDSNDDGMQLISGHEDAVNSLVWVRELQCLVSGAADGVICAWDMRNSDGNISACVLNGSFSRCFGHASTVRSLCCIHQKGWVASASFDSSVKLWKIEEARGASAALQLIEVGTLGAHQGPVNAVVPILFEKASSSEKDCCASGSADRSIIVWDLDTLKPVSELRDSHELGVSALAPLPVQEWIASGSADMTVKLWQPACDSRANTQSKWCRLELVTTLRGHSGTVHALACLSRNGWLASASSDRTVRVWRVENENMSRAITGRVLEPTSVVGQPIEDAVAEAGTPPGIDANPFSSFVMDEL